MLIRACACSCCDVEPQTALADLEVGCDSLIVHSGKLCILTPTLNRCRARNMQLACWMAGANANVAVVFLLGGDDVQRLPKDLFEVLTSFFKLAATS